MSKSEVQNSRWEVFLSITDVNDGDWKRSRASQSLVRLTGASGWDDPGFSAIAGLHFQNSLLWRSRHVTGDSFSDLCPFNFTNSNISLSFSLLKLFTHQSCILSNMLYPLQSHYSREKMKVLLQFRFVGDTAKKKKWSLLRGRRTFGWWGGGGALLLLLFLFNKNLRFLMHQESGEYIWSECIGQSPGSYGVSNPA